MKGLLFNLVLLVLMTSGVLRGENFDRDLELVQKFLLFTEHRGLEDSRRFEDLKGAFVESLGGNLIERALAEEIRWEIVEDVREVAAMQKNYQLFYQLRLAADDQSNISRMIKYLGDLGWMGLLKKKETMEKLGDKVFPVHPLRFLGYVIANPSLKKRVPKIMGDFVKRKSFLNGHGKRIGFAQRMSNEAARNNMLQYVPGFAQSVGVSESSIISYFHAHDWEGLIRELM